ncbi:hypothetical protein C9E82_23635 [Paracoccus siganidrum]|uniref:AraC-type arabinose-binding/dimerisation domain-containing protein n=1 Tax=Paracoccus siganidrum TaxID=1276757 RepID=A0A419A482_9RHOB|nr:hypothetical protein [Paracoccus siganidrum]RJL08598.1 hypothetical protein D3P05_15835 [Paracoccus siganidrum]RMC24066.1 hypothetical protein C9E82_23635 [Paracoccus siganidrum]
MRLDNEETLLADGDFLFIPAQVVHGFSFRTGSEGMVLSFPLAVLRQMRPASAVLSQLLSRPISGRVDANMARLIDRIAEGFAGNGAFRANLLVALSQALLASVCAAGQGASPEAPARHRMQEFDALILRRLGDGCAANWQTFAPPRGRVLLRR